MYYLKGKNFWQKKHAIAIPLAKFISTNFRESVIKLAAKKKMFGNRKGKYLGKIVKIGHGRNLCKECENLQIVRKFLPRKKFIPLRYL